VQHVQNDFRAAVTPQLESEQMPLGAAVATEVAGRWWSGPRWSPPHQGPAGKSNKRSAVVTDDLPLAQSCTSTEGAGIAVLYPSGEDTPPLEVISDDATSPCLQEAEHAVFHENAKRLRTDDSAKIDRKAPQDMIHKSHTTKCTRGMLWCMVCGNYMPMRTRVVAASGQKLNEPCALHASGMSGVYRSRLSAGFLPKSNMVRWPDGTPAEQSMPAQKPRLVRLQEIK